MRRANNRRTGWVGPGRQNEQAADIVVCRLHAPLGCLLRCSYCGVDGLTEAPVDAEAEAPPFTVAGRCPFSLAPGW